jgi:nicotinic acid phosphoribosyltransferase
MPFRALNFLQPDVLVHVYRLWQAGEHDKIVHRDFVVLRAATAKPFAMCSVTHCVDYLANWRLTESDIAFLRVLPSFAGIHDGFWTYLAQLHPHGDVRALPDGYLEGFVPLSASEGIRKIYGDNPPLPLLQIEDEAGFVAMISEGLAAILTQSVSYSRAIVRNIRENNAPMFHNSERLAHPFWGSMARYAEFILGARTPFDSRSEHDLWLWLDPDRFRYPVEQVKRIREDVAAKTHLRVEFLINLTSIDSE